MVEYQYEGLYRVISGGQTGADQAGLAVAQLFNLETGGHIPRGFKTVHGPAPELGRKYGLIEHSSDLYPPRTKLNAEEGDATVRLASNFNSPGEILTLKLCRKANKPVFDVLLDGKDYEDKAHALSEFIKHHSVGVLNVAGNADRDRYQRYHFDEACKVLRFAFGFLEIVGLLRQR